MNSAGARKQKPKRASAAADPFCSSALAEITGLPWLT